MFSCALRFSSQHDGKCRSEGKLNPNTPKGNVRVFLLSCAMMPSSGERRGVRPEIRKNPRKRLISRGCGGRSRTQACDTIGVSDFHADYSKKVPACLPVGNKTMRYNAKSSLHTNKTLKSRDRILMIHHWNSHLPRSLAGSFAHSASDSLSSLTNAPPGQCEVRVHCSGTVEIKGI